jgi:large subunit ribosomal protein L10
MRPTQNKKDVVAKLKELIKSYKVIGLANLESLPAPQLQQIKAKQKDVMELFMTKKTLIRIALNELEKDRKNIISLSEHLKGMPALIFTNENPFKLVKSLNENKTTAPAKAGQTAPIDIVVKAGGTNFAPGPIIGELGKFGIKTAVENGKLAIKADAVVCKEGELITAELAGLLVRLDIKPMEVGVNVISLYEDGINYAGEVLRVDPQSYVDNVALAAQESLKLAIGINYLTKETVKPLIEEAYRNAFSLAIAQNIATNETINLILAKANAQGLNLKTKVEE